MGGNLPVLEHRTHLLMSCGIHLFHIGAENIQTAVGIVIVLRQILRHKIRRRHQFAGLYCTQGLCVCLLPVPVFVALLILGNLTVYVKGSFLQAKNLFCKHVNEAPHPHEVHGIHPSAPHHILRAVKGILDLIKKRLAYQSRNISLGGKGNRKTYHNRQNQQAQIFPDIGKPLFPLPRRNHQQRKQKGNACGKERRPCHSEKQVGGNHAKKGQLLPEIPQLTALFQLFKQNHCRRTFHHSQVGGRNGHRVENMGISCVSIGDIRTVQQGISGGSGKLENNAAGNIYQNTLLMLPHSIA